MQTTTSATPVRPTTAQAAEREIERLFQAAGWRVERERSSGADLHVRKAVYRYVVEIKAASEARADRVIALLSQAILQARAYAREDADFRPLAVVWVAGGISSLIEKITDFHKRYVPDVAIGLVSAGGATYFVGPGLDSLNTAPVAARKAPPNPRRRAHDLFSDLNQWMLKVLLAPEIPSHLLTAPRDSYRNAAALATAANVSPMSAFRLVTRLKEERYLDEAADRLHLVRRADLFKRWQSAAARSTPEVPMCFLMPGMQQPALRKLASRHEACLGLFAAADALGVGHVAGALPYVYVKRLGEATGGLWNDLARPAPTEPPQLVIKQAGTPESLFRGAVVKDGVQVADVLQVWLDVYSHPSRGAEQAALLQSKALRNVIGAEP